jgi:hypothetical protein
MATCVRCDPEHEMSDKNIIIDPDHEMNDKCNIIDPDHEMLRFHQLSELNDQLHSFTVAFLTAACSFDHLGARLEYYYSPLKEKGK